MSEYILSPKALNHLQGIWDFIASENREAADRVVDELSAAFEYLAEWPGSGHSRPDLTEKDLRFWPVRSYLVVYREKSVPLQIVAIFHGARDLPSILKNV
jgi:plasmid stabilization system protein ParE